MRPIAAVLVLVLHSSHAPLWAQDQPAIRSPRTATALSVASTIVPLVVAAKLQEGGSHTFGAALGAFGIVIGPSVGHFYLGHTGLVVPRAALLLGLFVIESIPSNSEDPHLVPTVLLLAGLGGLALFDIDRVASVANERSGQGRRLVVVPTLLRGETGLRPAIGVRIRF